MRKPATMRDVAIAAGVSTATVSNVLSGRRGVDADLAERVRAAAQRLDYRVDRVASQLRSGRTRVVAVLVPSIENPYFTALIAALERLVRADGYDIVVASASDTAEIERERLAALMAWRPAGLIVTPTGDDFLSHDLIAEAGLPYVVMDRVGDAPGADSVTIDNAAAARLAADHLIALGHGDILVVASSLGLANIRARAAGIAAAYAAVGRPAPPVLEGGLTFEAIGDRFARHIAANGRPSAVIALTNFATLGVLAALADHALDVPGDVSLIGFDDYAWMRVARPSITAIAQPVEAMAAAAWQRLQHAFAGDQGAPQRLQLAARLEIRGSTRSVGPPLHGG
jgi:DNA-binding LacI/PurR family transcriptional regulator